MIRTLSLDRGEANLGGCEPRNSDKEKLSKVIPIHLLATNVSSGRIKTSGTIRSGAPFRRAVFPSLRQCALHTFDIEVLGIDRRAWLLPPGLIKPSGIDSVKAQFIHEL